MPIVMPIVMPNVMPPCVKEFYERVVRQSHVDASSDAHNYQADPDDDSDTEADRNDEGKVAGVAPPPGLTIQLHYCAQPQPVTARAYMIRS